MVDKPKEFDFLIGGEFLRGTLEELVLRNEALKGKTVENEEALSDAGETIKSKIGVEDIIEVEYVERTPAPNPENCLIHDDWVSSIDATTSW